MAMRTPFCFAIPAVSAASYERASEQTNNPSQTVIMTVKRRHVACPDYRRSRDVDTHSHDVAVIMINCSRQLDDDGRGTPRWAGDFCVILPVHILPVLHYPTEYLGTPSLLGQRLHILVSCQSGTRIVRIHMVL